MLWHEDTDFRVVIVDAGDPSVVRQILPTRSDLLEAAMDIDCFFHRCKCYKTARATGCLAYTKVGEGAVTAHIDNDRGARASTYGFTYMTLHAKLTKIKEEHEQK